MRLLRRDNLTSDVAQGLRSMSRNVEDGFVRAFAWLATTVYRCAGDWCRWRPLLTRSSAHLAVVVVAVVAIALSTVEWSALAAPASSASALQLSGGSEQDAGLFTAVLAESNGQNGDSFVGRNGNRDNGPVPRLAQPHTIIPDRPRLASKPIPFKQATRYSLSRPPMACSLPQSCGLTLPLRMPLTYCVSARM